MAHESRTLNFQYDTPALSIAGPQDERWPVAAVDGSDLRLEVVFTLTGGTTSIAEIVPHTARTHRLRGSMLAIMSASAPMNDSAPPTPPARSGAYIPITT